MHAHACVFMRHVNAKCIRNTYKIHTDTYKKWCAPASHKGNDLVAILTCYVVVYKIIHPEFLNLTPNHQIFTINAPCKT